MCQALASSLYRVARGCQTLFWDFRNTVCGKDGVGNVQCVFQGLALSAHFDCPAPRHNAYVGP